MLGNLTGITSTTRNETVDKKLQEQIDVLKTEVDTIEDQLDALNDNVDTNVVDATTGNIDNVNATSVSSTFVSATNVNGTNGTFNNLTVNGTVQNLSVTNGNIQNIFADDVDTNTLEADSATITALRGTNATIDNLTVTSLKADTVDIGTITDDIDSENATIDDLTSINVTAQQINTDDIQADTGGIGTLGATTITSNTVNTTDLNATNISASDIDTLRVDASRMTSGIFSLNKDFFININTNVNDIGVIKMPAFDGVARLSFVNSSELEQLTMTVINNEVEKKQILVNFSQKAGRLNGFAISANNELLIGVNGGSIVKMYYTFDTSEEFNAIPEQLPITDFPNDIQYSWLATSELSKTLCFIEPNTPTQGFEVTGMFKADSLEWTSVSIDNLDVIYDLTVRNDAYIGNDLHLKTFDITGAPVDTATFFVNNEGDVKGIPSLPSEYTLSPVKYTYKPGATNSSITETTGTPPALVDANVSYIETENTKLYIYDSNEGFGSPYVDGAIKFTGYIDKSTLTECTETEANMFRLLIKTDSLVNIVDNKLTSLEGVYYYRMAFDSTPTSLDEVVPAANVENVFHLLGTTITPPAGDIIIDGVSYKNSALIGSYMGIGDENKFYFKATTPEGTLLEKGIKILDSNHPDEKVDLVNVKAEDAYTADYATKALQDNNGDQIDTTYQKLSEKAQPNGYASLDANGRIPYSQLPESAVEFKGTWDASTNTPTLPTGSDVKGDMYIVNIAGTQMGIDWYVGDQAIYDGTTYQRISGSEVGVDTVNGLKDAVTIANATVNGQTITVDTVSGQTVTSDASIEDNTPVGQTRVAYSTATISTGAGETVSGPWTMVCQKYDSTHYTLTTVNTSNGRTFTKAGSETYWHEKKGFFYKNYYFTTDYSSAVGIGFQTTAAAVNHDICVAGHITKITTSGYIRVPFKAWVRGNAATVQATNVEVDKDISSWCKFARQASDNTIRFAIVCKPSNTYTRFTFEIDTVMIGDVGSDTYAVAPTQTITNATALSIWNGTQYTEITPTVKEMNTSTLTLAQYNALGTKAAGTLYLITG